MNARSWLTSLLYSITQITVGLLLHPYQTVQSLAKENVFSWLIFLPTSVFVLAKFTWFYILVPFVRYFFSCQTSTLGVCEIIPFVANWLFFFCLYWQVLLLYLLLRFWSVFR